MYGVASLVVVGILLPFIGTVLVALRFFVRLRLKPTFLGIDDWLILFACVLVWSQGAIEVTAAIIGELGRDDQETVPWRIENQQKLDYAVLLIEKITYSAIKLSVLFFYRRIFVQKKSFRIANDILIALTTLWGVIFLFTFAFLCKADSFHGHACAPQEWGSLWFAITDVLGDIAILALPYPCIRALQMKRNDKIGLSAIFLLGTLALIFGIVRLGFVAKTFALYYHPSKNEKSPFRSPSNLWTTVEVSVGLIAACLPPLGPLIRRTPSLSYFRSKLRSLSWRSSHDRKSITRLSSDENFSGSNGPGRKEKTAREDYEMDDVRKHDISHALDSGIAV